MRSKLAVLFVFLGTFYYAAGQSSYDDQNTVSIPSANNDFLKSQPDMSISLYTGVPQVTVPLYTLPSRELTLPIALDYVSAGGIKVQDIAGFAGLGWQLDAGGSISRVVRGKPDEQDSGYIGIHLYGQTISAGLTSTLVTQIGTGIVDGEPDLFTVRTPYFSFTFVLDQYGNPVFANNTGLKITHQLYNNPSWQTTSWVITDADGTQYFFGSTANSIENSTTILSHMTESFISSWYLDKIVSFNGKDAITLSYQAGPDYSVNHYMHTQTVFAASNTCPKPDDISSDYSMVTTYNAPKYIYKITSSLGEVDFTYAYDRQDFANAGRLLSMAVYPHDPATSATTSAIKTFQFNNSYFGGTSSPDGMRLRLDNIQLLSSISSDAPLTYKSFDYNTVNLPARNSVEFDYWGYYNTNPSGTTIVPAANKSPDPNRTPANVLVGIHDLSGEVRQLVYELNTYNNGGTNTTVGGLRVKQFTKTLPSGESLYTQYVYNDANKLSTGQINNQYYLNFTKFIGFLNYAGSQSCAIAGTSTTSESIYNSYDLNGNFVGYSAVTTVSQDGGYEIDQFTNFNDWPDQYNIYNGIGVLYSSQTSRQLSTATSLGYKRGLLTGKTVYTASGNMISQVANTYASLDAVSGKAMGVRATPFDVILGSSVSSWYYGVYVNNVENYRLTQTVQTIYDQNNSALSGQTVYNFTYAANHRLVQRTDYTDSKGQARSKTSYYTEDANIPYITGDEQYAINIMQQGNKTNAIIHSIEMHNQTSANTHYSYLSFVDAGLNKKVMLASKRSFINNSSQAETQQYMYDPSSVNLTSVNKLGGSFLSTTYGYNNTYMTAKVKNALNSSYTTVSNSSGSGTLYFLSVAGSQQSASFVVDYTGSVTIQLTPGNTTSGTMLAQMLCSLSGPATYSGVVCASGANACGSNSSSMTFSNVQPGNYTLTVSSNSRNNNPTTNAYVSYTYPRIVGTAVHTNEFYYEGFESNASAATATPFAGRRYMTGAFTVPFTMPNSRAYQIDYHYLSGGVWYPKTKPYTNNMVLNDGTAVDEVRVYPVDAQMTSYTYDPLNGLTSQCDIRNRFTFYNYDGFGRLVTIRDNDGNVVNNYQYQYQSNISQLCAMPGLNGASVSGLTVTVNFTPSPGSNSCVLTVYDESNGQQIVNTGVACGAAATFSIPARNRSYEIIVTSYTPDCPGGVMSAPITITVPQ